MSDEPRKTEMMRQLQVDTIPDADLIRVWNRLMRAPLRVQSHNKIEFVYQMLLTYGDGSDDVRTGMDTVLFLITNHFMIDIVEILKKKAPSEAPTPA